VTMEKILTCEVGDIVIHKGEKVWVSEVVHKGKEDKINKKGKPVKGERDCITVCTIMIDNGQILKRSPRYIDADWSHT